MFAVRAQAGADATVDECAGIAGIMQHPKDRERGSPAPNATRPWLVPCGCGGETLPLCSRNSFAVCIAEPVRRRMFLEHQSHRSFESRRPDRESERRRPDRRGRLAVVSPSSPRRALLITPPLILAFRKCNSASDIVPFKPATDSTVCCTLRMCGDHFGRRQPALRAVRTRAAGFLATGSTLDIGATPWWRSGCRDSVSQPGSAFSAESARSSIRRGTSGAFPSRRAGLDSLPAGKAANGGGRFITKTAAKHFIHETF